MKEVLITIPCLIVVVMIGGLITTIMLNRLHEEVIRMACKVAYWDNIAKQKTSFRGIVRDPLLKIQVYYNLDTLNVYVFFERQGQMLPLMSDYGNPMSFDQFVDRMQRNMEIESILNARLIEDDEGLALKPKFSEVSVPLYWGQNKRLTREKYENEKARTIINLKLD